MKIFFLALMSGLLTVSAAASVVVKPNVAEGLFACNAGVLHPRLNGQVCLSNTDARTCDPTKDANCVCFQDSAGKDIVNAQYEDMSVPDTHPAHFRATNVESRASSSDYQSLFADADVWLRKITTLKFDLASELTGSRYYVDFCYLGPVENLQLVNKKMKDLSEGIYTLNATVSSTSLEGDTLYRDSARLRAKVEFVCDLRESGKQNKPRKSDELAPDKNTLEANSSYYMDEQSLNSNGLSIQQNLNGNVIQVPRFCRLRASFAEGAITLRSHESANTEMTVFIDIQQAL
ncbi:MAG: hypothetical protein JSU04_09050 [Bdellovibrionales bacterium]|nr:hypothetical protein [Bdellovibrionales bacterium]